MTLKQIQSLLLAFDITSKEIRKFAKLSREYLYGRNLKIHEGYAISPFLEQNINDRPFKDLLKILEIYDFQHAGYFEKVWSFNVIFKNGFIHKAEIPKHSFEFPLCFEEAVSVALYRGLKAFDDRKVAMLAEQRAIEDEIEY